MFIFISSLLFSVPSACHSRCSINVMYRDELWQICPPILSRNASAFSASLKSSSCLKSFWFFVVRFVLHRPPLVRGPLSQGHYGTLSFRWIYNVFIWHSQWLHLVTSLTGCTCRGSLFILKGNWHSSVFRSHRSISLYCLENFFFCFPKFLLNFIWSRNVFYLCDCCPCSFMFHWGVLYLAR